MLKRFLVSALFFLGFSLSNAQTCPPLPSLGNSFPFIFGSLGYTEYSPGETSTFHLITLQGVYLGGHSNFDHFIWLIDGEVIPGQTSKTLTFTIPPLANGIHTLEVIPLNSCGQRNPDMGPITRSLVIKNPCEEGVQLVRVGTGDICVGESFSYVYELQNATGNYAWRVSNGATLDVDGYQVTVSFPVEDDYKLSASAILNSSCSYSTYITPRVVPDEILKVDGLTSTCAGNTETYTIIGGAGADIFDWVIPAGLTYTYNDAARRSVDITFGAAGVYPVSITPINNCGSTEQYDFSLVAESAPVKASYREFDHAALSAFSDNTLVVNTCQERTSDCRAKLTSLYLEAGLDLGDVYNWGNTEFSVEVRFVLRGQNNLGTEPFSYPGTLLINKDRPEQRFKIKVDEGDLAGIRNVTIDVTGYTLTGPVSGDVRFWAQYIEEQEVSVDLVALSNLQQSTTPGSWEVDFSWESSCNLVPHYQLRVLRVFQGETVPAYDDARWRNALLIDVESSELNYALTLAEGTGTYAWQVRPVGNKPGGITNPDNLQPWPTTVKSFVFTQPDADKNFIYSRTFTEGNRLSEQLTYANGLQQVNQQQTRLKSNNQIVATQTVQDYNGRDVLQSLPVPVKDKTELGYIPELLTTGTEAYGPEHFDIDPDDATPAFLDKPTLSDNSYYSGLDNGINKNVASAEGVPYTRTVFTNDGTGRVKEQAGVGATHSLKGGKTVRTYYTGVAPQELDRLFGVQAPLAANTHKVITLDANNTATVSYMGKDGKVIATALSLGTGNDNLDPLDSRAGAAKSITETIVEKAPFGEYGSSSKKNLVFTLPTSITVNYTLSPATVEDLCKNTCKTCDYVVTFILHNVDDPSATEVLNEHTLNAPGINCSESTTIPPVNFTKVLEEGSYVLEKRVRSLNRAASGKLYIDEHLEELQNIYEADLAAILDPIYNLLITKPVDLVAVYDYLDLQGYTRVTPAGGEAYYVVPLGCGEEFRLPYIEDNCGMEEDCSETGIDASSFSQYFIDYWQYEFIRTPRPVTDENPSLPAANGDYDFLKYNYKVGGVYTFTPQGFDAMIRNMMRETDAGGNRLYDCQMLWKVWKQQVQNYEYLNNMEIDPAELDDAVEGAANVTYEYNLIDNFFRSVEAELQQNETDPERQLIRKMGYYTTAPTADVTPYIYEYFYYDPSNSLMVNCMEDYIYYYNQVSATPCNQASLADQFTCLPLKDRDIIYKCTRFGNTSDPADNSDDMVGLLRSKCLEACESYRDAFRQAVIDDIHNKQLYVEGDIYTLELDPVQQKYFPTGSLRSNPSEFNYSICQIEEMTDALVANCNGYCNFELEQITDENGFTGPGISTAQQEKIKKVLTAEYEVSVNTSSETSCQVDWDYIPSGTAGSNSTHKLLLGFDHDGMIGTDLDTKYDEEGNLYVTSRIPSSGVVLNDEAKTVITPATGKEGFIVLKYDNQGNILWHRIYWAEIVDDPSVPVLDFATFQLSGPQQLGIGFNFISKLYPDPDRGQKIRVFDENGTALVVLPEGRTAFMGAISASGETSYMGRGDEEEVEDQILPVTVNDRIIHKVNTQSLKALNFDGTTAWTYQDVSITASNGGGVFKSEKEIATDLLGNTYYAVTLNAVTAGSSIFVNNVDTGYDNIFLIQKIDGSGTGQWRRYELYNDLQQGDEFDINNALYDFFGYEQGVVLTYNKGLTSSGTSTGEFLIRGIKHDNTTLSDISETFSATTLPQPFATSFRESYAAMHQFHLAVASPNLQAGFGYTSLLKNDFSTYGQRTLSNQNSRVLDFYFDRNDSEVMFMMDGDIVGVSHGTASFSQIGDVASFNGYNNRLFINEPVTAPGCSYPSLCFRFGDPITEITVPDVFDDYIFTGEPFTCDEVNANSIISKLDFARHEFVTRKVKEFEDQYYAKCADATLVNDVFTVGYDLGYHHYTLYYYDRAGNLMRTVPPAGVNLADPDNHNLVTNYKYNSLGQLVKQTSPDGGTTDFYFNDLGQLRFSQNARQKQEGSYSYTKYDALGRIIEVGVSTEGLTEFKKRTNSQNFPSAGTEKTVTVYTEPGNITYSDASAQRYLQNRVSYSYLDEDGLDTPEDRVYTYYSYDPHGNVEWMVQDIPGILKSYIRYKYDLISGNVLQVSYNEGFRDQFYHRYEYDEDNRILKVETSGDGVIWEEDASYEYYRHGPLKRTLLGEDELQGNDYVYTIHGWLKMINYPDQDQSLDPGNDGSSGSIVGKDAFGMRLNYYENDYTNGQVSSSGRLAIEAGRELYNGNIAGWENYTQQTDLNGLQYDGKATAYNYRYDELNRLKFGDFAVKDGTVSAPWTSYANYNVGFTYDANGNLKTLERNAYERNGLTRKMDALTYAYYDGTNKLKRVADGIPSTNWDEDIDDQPANNYEYDEIGNLTADLASGVTNIDWTVYGKVKSVTKSDNSVTNYRYDAQGNRVMKEQIGNEVVRTYYVRDASGNVMATYNFREETFTGGKDEIIELAEQPIYGSDRVGQRKEAIEVSRHRIIDTSIEQVESDVLHKPALNNWTLPVQTAEGTALVQLGQGATAPEYVGATEAFSAEGYRHVATGEDSEGNLLFSLVAGEDGTGFILDGNGNVMPGSAGVSIEAIKAGAGTSLVMPSGEAGVYYLFTIGNTGKAYRHTIDMNLAGNGTTGLPLGDVALTNEPVNATANYASGMALMVEHDRDGLTGYLYLLRNTSQANNLILEVLTINKTGIGSPMVIDAFAGNAETAHISISPNGQKLAVAVGKGDKLGFYDITTSGSELRTYSLSNDYITATLDQTLALGADEAVTSIHFTADNDYLYYVSATLERGYILQRVAHTAGASLEVVTPLSGYSMLAMAANEKFYVVSSGSASYLQVEHATTPVVTQQASIPTGTFTGTMPAQPHTVLRSIQEENLFTRRLENKHYELKDHLGNIRAVISDRKLSTYDGSTLSNYHADLIAAYNYYPFGMEMPGRTYNPKSYRYGFNGKEKDQNGEFGLTAYDYGFRIYNPAIGKFLSVDPLMKNYPMLTPYQFASNRPIDGVDLDGLEWNPYQTYKFWTGFGTSIAKGTWSVISYVANNPNHAGYGYPSKPSTEAEISQYRINWSQQLDPYYQIRSFSENTVNTVQGIYRFGEGVYEGDGEKAAKALPSVIEGALFVYGGVSRFAGMRFRNISSSVIDPSDIVKGYGDYLLQSYSKKTIRKLHHRLAVVTNKKTNYSYVGRAGAINSIDDPAIHPILKNNLSKKQIESWHQANCAECDATNQALWDGAKWDDLTDPQAFEFKNSNGGEWVPIDKCDNCKVTYDNK
ncbi:hypothetical protein LVD17_19035 [Fulvivirga ulvae]|uniref:RHS repeat-associated core domain-containing protein n=1 Tax=Fulvivirga ulvae TaxID=2904245 RepID=UPI001F2172D4|nr:RHS repeat-associated core domain-containing protein [Fulvivirga ulvae]UII30389.1 hypothetical protein LVD17_19035 [Fulvivirga ulvae]